MPDPSQFNTDRIVRVGAAVQPKSGCLRYWKACGRVSQLRCMSLKNLATLIDGNNTGTTLIQSLQPFTRSE
jgi:hypothetical protein